MYHYPLMAQVVFGSYTTGKVEQIGKVVIHNRPNGRMLIISSHPDRLIPLLHAASSQKKDLGLLPDRRGLVHAHELGGASRVFRMKDSNIILGLLGASRSGRVRVVGVYGFDAARASGRNLVDIVQFS